MNIRVVVQSVAVALALQVSTGVAAQSVSHGAQQDVLHLQAAARAALRRDDRARRVRASAQESVRQQVRNRSLVQRQRRHAEALERQQRTRAVSATRPNLQRHRVRTELDQQVRRFVTQRRRQAR